MLPSPSGPLLGLPAALTWTLVSVALAVAAWWLFERGRRA